MASYPSQNALGTVHAFVGKSIIQFEFLRVVVFFGNIALLITS